ncbi:protein FAM78A isoform X1 [Ascaphus truei]|uniref:protein FAM78A isoform X1 n=1 Tax=Ascaphus truei TaxID=8439 RepID=UPI003F590F96
MDIAREIHNINSSHRREEVLPACDLEGRNNYHLSMRRLPQDCLNLLEIALVLNTMGCIQSLSCKPKVFRESISILDVNASIDSTPTSIDESSNVVLRYRTPHFRATAQVLVPTIATKETWRVGWIQACNHMEFYNYYGDLGMSSWELPDLESGKISAISDSDGVNYPWYGNTTETCTVTGPTKRETKFTVSMNDNFYPSVTWAVPVSEGNVPKLTGIHRDQSFTTWLVAINMSSSDLIILQTIKWRMKLEIDVNPCRPLGQRAKLKEPFAQEKPRVLNKNEPIPSSALVKPNANDAQVLMWRPKNRQPTVVIPPKRRLPLEVNVVLEDPDVTAGTGSHGLLLSVGKVLSTEPLSCGRALRKMLAPSGNISWISFT